MKCNTILFILFCCLFSTFLFAQQVSITVNNRSEIPIEFYIAPIENWGTVMEYKADKLNFHSFTPKNGETTLLDLPDSISYVLVATGNKSMNTFTILRGMRNKILELQINYEIKESSESDDLTIQANETNEELGLLNKAFMEEMLTLREIMRKGRKNINLSEVQNLKLEYLKKMNDENQPLLIRQLYAYLSANPIDTSIIDQKLKSEILRICPPTSDIWSMMNPTAFQTVSNTEDNQIDTLVTQQFATENPNKTLRAYALGKLASFYYNMNNHYEFAKIIATLKKEYPEQYEMATLHLNIPEPELKGEIPEFDFLLMDSGTKITKSELKGSYYLIDFWGTWCSGCRLEISNLTKIDKKYKAYGFKIISVAIFNTNLEVMKFREEKFSMPWMHVVLGKENAKEIMKQFKVRYTPHPILVDPNGKIITEGYGQLTGESLQKKLKEIYGF